MNEYIFFDVSLRDRFMAFVSGLGLASSARPDPIAGFVVALPAELDDDIAMSIEDEYDVLMDEQRALIEAADRDDSRALMAVHVTLPDGQPGLVRIPALYGRRLVEHFSIEEIQDLVAVIAQGLLEPVGGPICRKV